MKKLSVINKGFIKAAQNNQLDELKNLLGQGADIHADRDGALRWSAADGHLEIAKFLIAHGANIHAYHDSALRDSAFYGHLKIVKFLIAHGANIHADCDGALRWSAAHGHIETVKFLVTQGANVHVNNDEALRESACNGHLEVVKFLVAKGVNIHINDNEIFKTAIKNKNEPMLMLLNAFLNEEKLLVAALGSMPLVAASVFNIPTTGVCNMPQTQVLAPVDSDAATISTAVSSVASTQRRSITKAYRTKI